MALYNCAKADNPDYWITIKSKANGAPLEIIVDMPETLTTSTSSEWESRLPYNLLQSFLGGLGKFGDAAGAVANSAGLSNIVQNLSYQMWTDSAPIELQLTLQMDAEESAYRDVWSPLMLLSGLVLPTGGDANGRSGMFSGDSILYAPGPTAGRANSEGAVAVHIGKQLALLDCIMITGSPQWDSQLASDGYPIRGQLDVTFRTSKIYGRVDWMSATGVRG